ILGLETARDRIHLRSRLLNSDLGFQSAPHIKVIPVPHLPGVLARCQRMWRHIPWRGHPKLAVIIGRKVSRHYSDDGETLPIQNELLSNHVRLTAETSMPKFVSEDGDMIVSGPRIVPG